MENQELIERIASVQSYVENYVQPLAESVQKLVSFMDQLESRMSKMEQTIQELKEAASENDADFAQVFKKLSELALSTEIVKG